MKRCGDSRKRSKICWLRSKWLASARGTNFEVEGLQKELDFLKNYASSIPTKKASNQHIFGAIIIDFLSSCIFFVTEMARPLTIMVLSNHFEARLKQIE